jgi:hypothetical protein
MSFRTIFFTKVLYPRTISGKLCEWVHLLSTIKLDECGALECAVDSIQEGQFYLLYVNNGAILDGLLHGLLVNCILPAWQHGFESMQRLQIIPLVRRST